jgi:hypothetical protein
MMEKEIKLFNFRENWHMVKPHLNNPELIEVLNSAMNESLENWYILRTEEGYKVDRRPRYKFGEGSYPWALTTSDGIFCRECGCTPVDGTYRSYQLLHGCHWIAQWAEKLGALMFPEYEWELWEGEKHTIALGEGEHELLVFDILLFENNDPSSLIDFVEGFECDINYAQHEYDREKNICTCWGTDEKDIEAYRKKVAEDLAEMEEYHD